MNENKNKCFHHTHILMPSGRIWRGKERATETSGHNVSLMCSDLKRFQREACVFLGYKRGHVATDISFNNYSLRCVGILQLHVPSQVKHGQVQT